MCYPLAQAVKGKFLLLTPLGVDTLLLLIGFATVLAYDEVKKKSIVLASQVTRLLARARKRMTAFLEMLTTATTDAPFLDREENTKYRCRIRRRQVRERRVANQGGLNVQGTLAPVKSSRTAVGKVKRQERYGRRLRRHSVANIELRTGGRDSNALTNVLADVRDHYEMQAVRMDLESAGLVPGSVRLGSQEKVVTSQDPAAGDDAMGAQSFSRRNPRGALYVNSRVGMSGRMLVAFLKKVTMLVVIMVMLVPLHVLATPGLRTVLTAVGTSSYLTAEQQTEQLKELENMKLRHDGAELADQFSHTINSHLPDGISSQVDPTRYEKDAQCGLVMDRVPGVDPKSFEELRGVLREAAADVVAYKMEDITGYNGVEPPMQIDLDTTAQIFCPARRNWSPAELKVIDEKCEELILSGIVQRIVTSDYACNPVLAMKRAPDGTWSDKRFCVNFIPINKHTELDRYGSHRADELFQRVVRSKFLTALDLRSGFHQIPMHPDSIAKTAFWYVSGKAQPPQLLAYHRMPFGLKNASAKFQRVMDAELQRSGCSEFAFAYIDDLLIASDTFEEHVEHVRRVLLMLKEANLKIHPDKSVFATNIVEYLGHNVVGQHGITMNEAKVESIKCLPDPKNVGDLRSILGFLAYYRHFIPGFSAISAPMNELLKKDKPWDWGARQASAYATLKRLMTEEGRVLRPVDPDKPLILHTDWSVHGIGAVLGQLDDDGNEYLCACISRSLNKHERQYPSYKGELFGLAWAVCMFRHHVYGTQFRLVTCFVITSTGHNSNW